MINTDLELLDILPDQQEASSTKDLSSSTSQSQRKKFDLVKNIDYYS